MDGWSRKKWILVYVLAVVLGTLFHFVYGFTGENRIVGYFFHTYNTHHGSAKIPSASG